MSTAIFPESPLSPASDPLMQLQETLASDPGNPSHHYNLGFALWTKGEEVGGDGSKEYKERAAEHFVASAKLNPSNGAAFRFLGHYYGSISVDAQRASKCYQRAVALNPEDFEAGEGLCDLLDRSGQESMEMAVCREASEKSPRAFWAFRRLGYLQVHQKKWLEGVQSLQHAIRGYPACANLWEALGLAYQRLGMFTAAIKSYERAIELEGSRVFALVESGNILLMLGSFRKGVEQFRHALEITPRNLSALFGLASGLLGWSRECVNFGAFGWGAALLEEASEVAMSGTLISGNVSSIWKLHGDIQIAYAKCFPWKYESNISDLDEETFKASIDHWKETCLIAATSAKRSYQRALHLTPWKANIYADVAVSLGLAYSLGKRHILDLGIWQLPERMAIGGLMLERVNAELWVVLSCLSNDCALKQHALIRALQLDLSLSIAWAYLGKFYRKLGEKKLAKQAFDHARSIDPSLALPWVGMSVDCQDGEYSPNEAYESCLRAVQIMPLAEFQLGLGSLAAVSGHLLSPEVFGAIRQATQRAPYYSELHNLNGLVCEARSDYQSAIAAYRNARCALRFSCKSKEAVKSFTTDVSFNLARSLCQAGYALDAEHECEDLKKDGLLDCYGFQIYAVALWKLGKSDNALTVARNLFENVSTMSQTCATAALGLICTLIYCIKGHKPASSMILRVSKDFLQNIKLGLIVTTLHALEPSGQLQLLLPNNFQSVRPCDRVTEMHSIIASGDTINHGSNQNFGNYSGMNYLKKVLHMYPNSHLLRSQLCSRLLSSGDWVASHMATRCAAISLRSQSKKDIKSPHQIHGTAGVACYNCTVKSLNFSFPTCYGQPIHGSRGIHQLQRWLRQEPWNHEARYLLVLNILQKAREEKFPHHLCVTLKRLIDVSLSKGIYMKDDELYKHQRFLLLLCASEVSLQYGGPHGCISRVVDALGLPPSNGCFFAHLQLCRAYALLEDFPSLRNEYMTCLQIKTDERIGWISLKYLESRYKLENSSNTIDIEFQNCSTKKGIPSDKWAAVFSLVSAQSFIWDQNFVDAEQILARACSVGDSDSCLLLCHGAVCMELVRQQSGSQYLWRAVSSLTKAQETSPVPLPIVSALLAQAEASLGVRAKWESNLRLEWFSWPTETRPAELYFQMHLLAKQPSTRSDPRYAIESSQSSEKWILRAIHLNPSCLRYWKVLHKLIIGS